jgi:hypothetical protein
MVGIWALGFTFLPKIASTMTLNEDERRHDEEVTCGATAAAFCDSLFLLNAS